MNYRAWGIPAILSRGLPGNALRAFPGSFRNFSGISSGESQPYWGYGSVFPLLLCWGPLLSERRRVEPVQRSPATAVALLCLCMETPSFGAVALGTACTFRSPARAPMRLLRRSGRIKHAPNCGYRFVSPLPPFSRRGIRCFPVPENALFLWEILLFSTESPI